MTYPLCVRAVAPKVSMASRPCNWWLSIHWTLIDLSVSDILRKSSLQIPPLSPLSIRDKKTARHWCLDTEYVLDVVVLICFDEWARMRPGLRIIVTSLRSPVQLSARCRRSDDGLRTSMMPSFSQL